MKREAQFLGRVRVQCPLGSWWHVTKACLYFLPRSPDEWRTRPQYLVIWRRGPSAVTCLAAPSDKTTGRPLHIGARGHEGELQLFGAFSKHGMTNEQLLDIEGYYLSPIADAVRRELESEEGAR